MTAKDSSQFQKTITDFPLLPLPSHFPTFLSRLNIKRPASNVWAGVVFWFMSLATFAMHINFSLRGIVDVSSFLYAGLMLCAAFLWLLSPRARTTYYTGAAALVLTVVRGFLTARTQYLLRHQFPNILDQVIITILLSLLLAWLAFRFVFGSASRSYFQFE